MTDMHAEAVAGTVDRIVARYHRDPSYGADPARNSGACDWISPEAIDRLQVTLGVPRTKIEGVAGVLFLLYMPSRAASTACCSPTTSPTACSATGIDGACANLWVERGKMSEDGLVSVGKTASYRHVRPRAGAAGQQPCPLPG